MKKRHILSIMIAMNAMNINATQSSETFKYADESFADIQMLRYNVPGFDNLSLRQKTLVYYLSEAALQGRDILFDQNGRYNLRIRKLLETIYTTYKENRTSPDFIALETYLKKVWFANGIHHHYAYTKFVPEFSETFFRRIVGQMSTNQLPLAPNQSKEEFLSEICPVIFSKEVMPIRVNQKDGEDLVVSSASNYYGAGVTQAEAETFYNKMKNPNDAEPPMYGMNSRLVKTAEGLKEKKWVAKGLYGEAIEKILFFLEKARSYSDTPEQEKVIDKLAEFYRNGDLRTFDAYNILWLKDSHGVVDFTNCFTESYGDPLGMKASWEAIVNIKDLEATKRTEKMSSNAQWFEDNSPVDAKYKKEKCKGVSAKVINAAILGGDLYPSTAIGINLPNSNWIRKEYGSKSVTIGNLTHAYAEAAHGNGFNQEFVIDKETQSLIDKYGSACDNLHTDLHECLGHGSGKMAPGADADSLKAYGSTIEEARADLFGLYYLADKKLIDLGLTPNAEAYKAQYYTYMMNGLLTQLVRVEPEKTIEEAHMRNRALIAQWVLEAGKRSGNNAVELVKRDGKTFVQINDYEKLRSLFGTLLAEIQRIKSEGDFQAARSIVETYGVRVDKNIHKEILERYARLHLAPYKGFINPVYSAEKDANGNIVDVKVSYEEGYEEQMLRYSKDYSNLPLIND